MHIREQDCQEDERAVTPNSNAEVSEIHFYAIWHSLGVTLNSNTKLSKIHFYGIWRSSAGVTPNSNAELSESQRLSSRLCIVLLHLILLLRISLMTRSPL